MLEAMTETYTTTVGTAAVQRETMAGSVEAELSALSGVLSYTHELAEQLRGMLEPVMFQGDSGVLTAPVDESPNCPLASSVRQRQLQAVAVNGLLREMIDRLRLS